MKIQTVTISFIYSSNNQKLFIFRLVRCMSPDIHRFYKGKFRELFTLCLSFRVRFRYQMVQQIKIKKCDTPVIPL